MPPLIGETVEVYWGWLEQQIAPGSFAALAPGESVWAAGMDVLGTGWFMVTSIMRKPMPGQLQPAVFIGLRRVG